MQTIYPFSLAELPDLGQVGGKALSLITMTAAGMPVPPGLVLAAGFFQRWVATLQATPEWAAAQIADKEGLAQAARALQALCGDLVFDSQQLAELAEALGSLQTSCHAALFAVRSSSPDEDLESASFAGSYETTLGVRPEGLEAAIRRSFASALGERVFVYRREHGFATDLLRFAVIVQEQVDAEAAGVAFSVNPLNNCYDEAVINANHGLGESVVSGDADPDVFVVDKLKGEIIETRTGSKQIVVTLNRAGGVTRSARAHPQQASITAAQVLELTQLVRKVESYYGKPMDIEWAFAAGKLYLLQARPITTYLPLPDEMITPPGQPKRLYANSTLIEQGLQDPLSVLGTDFLGYVLKQVGGAIGAEAVGPGGMTFTAGGGYYMNLSYALKLGMRNAGLAPGSFGDPRVTAILDNIDMRQYLSGELPQKLKALRGKMLWTMLPMVGSALDAYLRPAHILTSFQSALPRQVERIAAFSGAGLSLQAQAVELSELLPFFYGKYGIPMIVAAQIAQQRIRNLFRKQATQVQDHLINLGISLPGNKTTEMGELMVALASSEEVRRHASATDFVADLDARRLSPGFTQAWEHYMREFGMRCPREIDPATPRPSEQPAQFFEQLKTMSLAYGDGTTSRTFFEEARARREASYQALYATALQKGRNKARALSGYYKTWVLFGGYRETPKHYVIKVIGLFRDRALAMAHALVAQGRLDRPAQIFDLTIADIDRARTDRELDLRALAQERTVLTHQIRRSKLVARVLDSRGRIFYPPRITAADGDMRGVPISPGVVQGRVRVLRYATEKKLLPGEILVARATDPGWTPLFINARGIILEIGGALQHGAVVAREYGIPCVSGLDDATTTLHDGQLVEVDGSHGVVRLLDEAQADS